MDFPSVVTRYGLDTKLILAEGQLNDTVNLLGVVVIFTTRDRGKRLATAQNSGWSAVELPKMP